MKTIKTNTFYKYLLVLITLGIPMTIFGQNKSLQKTYNWKYNVSEDASLIFNNYDCDLNIKTWDKPSIEYKLHITITGSTLEDTETLDNYLDNLTFSNSSNHVDIDMRFWDQRTTRGNKTKLDLKKGDKVTLTTFKIRGELTIPKGSNLDLKSKYSSIELADILGKLKLELYNDKLYGGNVGSSSILKAKYCTIEFETMKNVTAELYNTDIETENIENLSLESKYSKIFGKNALDLNIDSYNDKLVFETTRNVNFSAKYSSFRAQKSGMLTADSYNCTIIIDDLDDIKINSKYSKFEFKNGESCTLLSAYNDGLKFSSLKNLSISESKYGSYKIDELTTSLNVTDGYSDKLSILKTGLEFKELDINEKYGKIEIGLPQELAYRFIAKIKYPNLNIDEAGISTKIKIKESSDLEYEGVKGIESPEMPLILVKGYSVSFSINNY